MASGADVKKEKLAPTLAVGLTANELELAMRLVTAYEVECDRASLAAQSGIGEAASVTLPPKLREAWRQAKALQEESSRGGEEL